MACSKVTASVQSWSDDVPRKSSNGLDSRDTFCEVHACMCWHSPTAEYITAWQMLTRKTLIKRGTDCGEARCIELGSTGLKMFDINILDRDKDRVKPSAVPKPYRVYKSELARSFQMTTKRTRGDVSGAWQPLDPRRYSQWKILDHDPGPYKVQRSTHSA